MIDWKARAEQAEALEEVVDRTDNTARWLTTMTASYRRQAEEPAE